MSDTGDVETGPAPTPEGQASGEALGRAIRVWRAARDWNRRELSDEAEVSYSYLSEIEAGKKQPSARTLLRLANALGVTASELVSTAEELGREDGAFARQEELLDEDTPASALPEPQRPGEGGRRARRQPGAGRREPLAGRPGYGGLRGARARQRRWFSRPRDAGPLFSSQEEEKQLAYARDADLLRSAKELHRLLAELDPDDRERLLDLAHRLAE